MFNEINGVSFGTSRTFTGKKESSDAIASKSDTGIFGKPGVFVASNEHPVKEGAEPAKNNHAEHLKQARIIDLQKKIAEIKENLEKARTNAETASRILQANDNPARKAMLLEKSRQADSKIGLLLYDLNKANAKIVKLEQADKPGKDINPKIATKPEQLKTKLPANEQAPVQPPLQQTVFVIPAVQKVQEPPKLEDLGFFGKIGARRDAIKNVEKEYENAVNYIKSEHDLMAGDRTLALALAKIRRDLDITSAEFKYANTDRSRNRADEKYTEFDDEKRSLLKGKTDALKSAEQMYEDETAALTRDGITGRELRFSKSVIKTARDINIAETNLKYATDTEARINYRAEIISLNNLFNQLEKEQLQFAKPIN